MSIEKIQARFASGNSVPVDKAVVPASEWNAVMKEVSALRALLAASAPQIEVGSSVFDNKTAADLLSGKKISDESVRRFVAASRWAHDDRASLQALVATLRKDVAARDAEIALLKQTLLDTEALEQPGVESYAHGPQDETVDDALRDVSKWLNERPNKPMDLRHVAMLYHALKAPKPAQPGVDPVAWQCKDKDERHWRFCSKEHYQMFIENPSELKWHEVRQLYTSPQPAQQAAQEPVAWGCSRFIENDKGAPIGTDDPELHWGKHAPDDGNWFPLYTAPKPAPQPEQQAVHQAVDWTQVGKLIEVVFDQRVRQHTTGTTNWAVAVCQLMAEATRPMKQEERP